MRFNTQIGNCRLQIKKSESIRRPTFKSWLVILFLMSIVGAIYSSNIDELQKRWEKTNSPVILDSIVDLLLQSGEGCMALEWETKRPHAAIGFDPATIIKAYRAYRLCRSKAQAYSFYKEIIAKCPQEASWYRNQSRIIQISGKPELAGDFLASGAIVDPKAAYLWLDASLCYKNSWNPSKAVMALFEFAQAESGKTSVAFQYLRNLSEEDSSYLQRIDSLVVSENPLYPVWDVRYQWAIYRHRYEEAFANLKKMKGKRLIDSLALDLATRAMNAGKYTLIKKIQTLVRENFSNHRNEWAIMDAEAEKAMGHLEAADRLYQKQWIENTNIQTAKLYGHFLLYDMHDASRALPILRKAQKFAENKEDHLILLRMIFECRIILAEFSGIEEDVEAWQKWGGKENSTSAELSFLLGEIEATKGNMQQAVTMWEKTVKDKKGRDINDAIQLVALFKDMQNDTASLSLFWRTMLFSKQGKFLLAADSLVSITDHFYDNTRTTLVLLASEWYSKGNHPEKAYTLLNQEKDLCAECEPVLLGLARLYLQSRSDTLKAIETYESFLIKYPNSLFSDEAREHIKKFK